MLRDLNFFVFCVLLLVTCIVHESECNPLCDSRGSPTNGGMHIRLRRPTGIAVVYSCESGYKLQGATLAVCIQGRWTHPLPTCQKIVIDALNDARSIKTDAGVIVSTDELDTKPDVPSKPRQRENSENRQIKRRKLRRRRKKKRRRNKSKVSHLEKRKHHRDGEYRRPWLEAEQSHPPDVSCLSGNKKSSGFTKAPRIDNAVNPRYVRRKAKDKRYVAAVYSCKHGFVLQNPHQYSLYCSDGKWVGTWPVCLQGNVTAKPARCNNAGCEHGCKEIDGKAQCFCFIGFTQAGTVCNDVNECQYDNGGCEHLCFNTPGSYYCQCKEGFRLSDNLKSCTDVNECLLRNGHGPCQGSCTNTWGSYYCSCDSVPGTTLGDDSRSCRDIDECNDSTHNMHCSHSCINTIGTAFCLCPIGYTLGSDWKTCLDINECLEEEMETQCPRGCVNTEGSYYCAHDTVNCTVGYRYIDGQCKDTDECSSPTNGGCTHKCINTDGSYECDCPKGYHLSEDKKTCLDTDECLKYPIGDICSHICINNIGSYNCDCPIGYELCFDNKTCEQVVDECETKNCSHKCNIENRIAQCTCEPGYRLDNDSVSCVDVDECTFPDGIVSCSHDCANEIGSFRCLCPEGYILSGFYNCVDYDECSSENPCSDICVNTEGSYHCECPGGYYLVEDERTCRDINECENVVDEDALLCSHVCINTPGSFYCECREGYALSVDSRTCNDIDECTDNNEVHTSCSHECVNSIGTYYCLCPAGYVLDKDNTTCLEINVCDLNNGGCSHTCRFNVDKVVACDCPDNYYLSNDNKTCLETLSSSVDTTSFKITHEVKQNASRGALTITCVAPTGLCTNVSISENGLSKTGYTYICYNVNDEKNVREILCYDDYNNCHNNHDNSTHSDNVREPVKYVTLLNEIFNQSSSCLVIFIEIICSRPTPCVNDELHKNEGNLNEKLSKNETQDFRVYKAVFKSAKNKSSVKIFLEKNKNTSNVCGQVNVTDVIRDTCNYFNDDSVTNKTLIKIIKYLVSRFYEANISGGIMLSRNTSEQCDGNCTLLVLNNECDELHDACNTHCPDGYYPDGNECLDINECDSDISCNGTCINTVGSYICYCPEGLTANGSVCVETENYLTGCNKIMEIENGEIECTEYGDNGVYPMGAECFVKCKTGYKLKGKKSTVCEENGIWSENNISCVANPRPFIRCPGNSRYILPKREKEMMVHISQPKTNVNWTRYVTSVPSWGKQLHAVLTLGVTTITFKANSPVSDYVASCRMLVTVIDVEKPTIEDCPDDIYVKLAPGTSVQKVVWKEPVFSDNINVAHVYKTKSPGQLLSVGNHRVTYVAADSSGNIATCQFAIDITESKIKSQKFGTEVRSLPETLIDYLTEDKEDDEGIKE